MDWNQKADDKDPQNITLLPHHQRIRRIVHELITHPKTLSLTLSLKTRRERDTCTPMFVDSQDMEAT